MNKIENATHAYRKEDKQNTSSVLWWMKKGKDAVYVKFVNNMRIA